MKILFVFRCDFNTQPLGIMMLASVLKQAGHTCNFIDLRFDKYFLRKIINYKPDILAYSIVSFNWQYYVNINLKIKRRLNALSVFGGPHCSSYPDFINEEGVDIMCVGEGEHAFLELVNNLTINKDITNIKNLWVKKDGIIYKNELRPPFENLNALPFADQDIIRKYQFYKNTGMFYVKTSRGCKYNCPYCIDHLYKKLYVNNGRYLRHRSVQNVIEELIILKNKYKAKFIAFVDEIFVLDKDWLFEFSTEYQKYINLPFEAYVRVEETTPNVVKILKEMGCYALYLGIETGNQELREKVLRRNMTKKQILETSALIKENNIILASLNMTGLPDETIENTFETLEINAQCKITYPLCFMFQPFPNYKLTQYAIDKGYFDGNTKRLSKIITEGKSPLHFDVLKKMERLHFLFIIGVKLPLLIPLIRILVKIPMKPLYKLIFFVSKSYLALFIYKKPFILKQYVLYHLKYVFYKTAPFLIKK